MNPEEIKKQKQQEGKRRNRIIIITIVLLLFVLVIAGGVTPTLFNGFFNKAPLIPVSEVTKPIAPKVNTPKDEEILIPEETQVAAIDEAIAPIITPEPAKIKPKFSPLKIKPPIINPIPDNITIPNTPEIPDTPEIPNIPEIPDEPEEEGEDPLWPYVTTFATSFGTGGVDGAWDIESLSDGSTLITGYLAGPDVSLADSDPSETILKDNNDIDTEDMFLIKYNPNGSISWAHRAHGEGNSAGGDISVLSDGSFIITGGFDGDLILGKGEINETSLIAVGEDLFIAKYNIDGSLAWAKRAGGSGYDYGSKISSLADGSSIVTAYFANNAIFGEGELNETSLSTSFSIEVAILKYNVDGTLAWAKAVGSGSNLFSTGMNPYAITTLSDGSSIIAGAFMDTAILGEGEVNETTLVSAGTLDILIAKYNSDGSLAWAKSAGGQYYDYASLDNVVLADGSSIITGEFNNSSPSGTGNATFGLGEVNETTLVSAGNKDMFIAKYNADGTLAWVKQVGGIDQDYGYDIGMQSDGSIIAAGVFTDGTIFGLGEPNEITLDTIQGWGVFISKYSADGTFEWVRYNEGSGNNYDFTDYPIVSVDSNDNIVLAGTLLGGPTFGLGDPGETALTGVEYNGDTSIFIVKYDSDGRLSDALPTQNPPKPCITPPISNNLILYLDICASSYSGTGTVWTDLSPSGDNGALTGPFKYSGGKDEGRLIFRKDRMVQVPLNTPKTLDTYSYNTWIRSMGYNWGYNYLIDFGNDTNVLHIYNNEISLYAPNYNTGFTLEVGKWYNVAVTHTVGEDIKFYVNGELIYTSPDTNSDVFNVSKYNIGGAFYDDYGGYIDYALVGNMSHVSIYDRALTQGELEQFFDATKSRFGDIGLVP